MNIITSNITTHLRTQSPSIVDYCLDYRTVSFLEFSILKLYNNCSFLCILQTHENTITFDTSEHRQSRRQGLETQARNMMTNRDIRDVPVT